MSELNKKQVGGQHYKGVDIEHWDWVHSNNLDYFQGQITKYVIRWKDKNGLEDLEKAKHFLEKYIELEQPKDDRQISLFPVTGMTHPFGYNKEEDDVR